jgi:SagB-type dehydrogenase family enzyme
MTDPTASKPSGIRNNQVEAIFRYHEETKHHVHRYARSLGYMDWDNQPNPFRFYEDVPRIALPFLREDPPFDQPGLYLRESRSSAEFGAETIGGFLELSLGLSAWKIMGRSRWSLRMNPSSGNLHPTEAHLILPAVSGIDAGVYHYNPFLHSLEKRAEVAGDLWRKISAHFQTNGFLIALCSIFWRESWKYGERGFRYCNHDAGHALAGLSFAANLFGWKAMYLNSVSSQEMETLLGFGQTPFVSLEEEEPELLCYVYPQSAGDIPRDLPPDLTASFASVAFSGRPNALSREHVNWEIIYRTAELTQKPATKKRGYDYGIQSFHPPQPGEPGAAAIIRRRRSATAFDRSGAISRRRFLAVLDKTLPRNECAPFDVQLSEPCIHLLLFVHRVEGLAAGLYFLCRNPDHLDSLKRLSQPDFLWRRIEEDLPLFCLQEGNFRQQAMLVSCHQDIAGHSAFSLGMIARFRDIVAGEPYRYRHLFWETGMVGQVLYLEGEACGLRGTGIGCFFDDAVHEILGFQDDTYQSLYHFTVGKPVEDPRLTTSPPYAHLKKS